MTTTSTPTQEPFIDPWAGCGRDCVLIDGVCRCNSYAPVTDPDPEWMDRIVPPF